MTQSRHAKMMARFADNKKALEAVLKQQQAEPSQWRDMVVVNLVREGVNKHKARELADHFAATPQQQAEPVAWRYRITSPSMDWVAAWSFHDKEVRPAVPIGKSWEVQPLYTTPPQREWVGLTDEDMKDPKTHIFDFIYGARWAEAKLKERNT